MPQAPQDVGQVLQFYRLVFHDHGRVKTIGAAFAKVGKYIGFVEAYLHQGGFYVRS